MVSDRTGNPAMPPPAAVPQELAGQILQASSNGVFALDADGRITLWNRRMEELYGTAAGEILGKPLFEAFPFLERSEAEAVRSALGGSGAAPEHRDFPNPPHGRAVFLESTYAPLRLPDGSVSGVFVVVRDVTEQRRTEEMLEESELRFRIMADSSPVLLWMAGSDSNCTFFNQGWLEFTGRTLELEYGTGWAAGVHPEDFQHCMHVYLNAFVERRDFRMEYRLRRADGEYRWILDTGRPRFASDGSFEGYIGSCIDITELRESAAALHRLNDELEDRVGLRTAELKHAISELESFSYSVSHDLRTPLRAIDGFSNILQELHAGSLDADGRHYLDRITSCARRMGELIDDLLNLARLTQAEMVPTRVDLTEASGLVVADLKKTDPERPVEVRIAEGMAATGDARLLRIVLENLIGNAWKFTERRPDPRIEIGAGLAAEGNTVYFVRDNGAGFDMAYSQKLFGAFQRLHRESEFEGTGIGLATVARIIHRHGGRIWADSRPDQGATFSFTLGGR